MAQDRPLDALCTVRPAKIEIDLDELFSQKRINSYNDQQQAAWRNLRLHRVEQTERPVDVMKYSIRGSVSVSGGPAEETCFSLCDLPSSGSDGGAIVLDCLLEELSELGENCYVVVTMINPFSCRSAEDNIILPYIAHLRHNAKIGQHPLGEGGIARQMIINRHYGIF